jgi:hypothetical protein
VLERWAGAAFVHVGGRRTADDVVFLVDAGPAPAAALV